MTILVRVCIAIALAGIYSGSASAIGILDDTDKDGPRFLGGFVIGNQFTVGGSNVEVDALGVWDQGDDGLAESHDVGLWDSAGAVVAMATVPAGTTGFIEDSYRYVALPSSVTLLAGQSYRIGALFQSTSDAFNDPWDPDGDGNPANSPAIGDGVAVIPGSGIAAVDGDYFAASAALIHPDSFGGGASGRWGAANALVRVPEPTSFSLFGICAASSFMRCRPSRRRS